MAFYFFNFYDGDVVDLDDDGIDLPDADAARGEAIAAARDTIIDLVLGGHPIENQRFEIVDADGLLVDVIRFNIIVDSMQSPKS